MKHLAKILVTASMATLLGMSSTANAKGSKKTRAKHATKAKAAAQPATPASDVPWYEQGIDDLAPVVKTKPSKVEAMQPVAPRVENLGTYQRRRTLAPSGLCTKGCDKTARNINMATLVLVKEGKAQKNSKRKKAKTKAKAKARASNAAAPRKVSRNTKTSAQK
jgi:hypothetical protein